MSPSFSEANESLRDLVINPELLIQATPQDLAKLQQSLDPQSQEALLLKKFQELSLFLDHCLGTSKDPLKIKNLLLQVFFSKPCNPSANSLSNLLRLTQDVFISTQKISFNAIQAEVREMTLKGLGETLADYDVRFAPILKQRSNPLPASRYMQLACTKCSSHETHLFNQSYKDIKNQLTDFVKEGVINPITPESLIKTQNAAATALNREIERMIKTKNINEAGFNAAYNRYLESYFAYITIPEGKPLAAPTMEALFGPRLRPEQVSFF